MPIWQIALIVLAVTWALQALGTWVQMRHYREVMGEIARRWSDGHLGAGNARSTFGKGVILVLVVGPDDKVRRLQVMEGRSVLAKFKREEAFEGHGLDELRAAGVFGAKGQSREKALAQAIEQIDRARARAAPAVEAVPQTADT